METTNGVLDQPKSERVKVKSCTIKTSTDKYTIYNIELEDGRKGQSFDKLEGDVEVEVSKNQYGLQFKKPKAKGKPFTKDYGFEKKRVALECAVAMANKQGLKSSDVIEVAQKFHDYLNS